MCNLYNVTTNQEAIRTLTKALDRLGNLEPRSTSIPTNWPRSSATSTVSGS